MGCCVPIVANADAYYTKSEIDEKIDEIVTSGCCITPEEVDDKISAATEGYATEQWVEDKHYITGVDLSDYALKSDIPTSNSAFTNDMGYLTEHQHLKTINGESLVGDGNIDISGTTIDLSDYFTKEETNELLDYKLDESAYAPTDLSDYYTKQEVDAKIPSLSGYVTNTEFIQYIENLQNQITSLQEVVSGCCGGGSGYTRWITMTGDNDFVCSGTTKYTKEKEQTSVNGIDWVDTGNYRIGDTVLEQDSADCGYETPYKVKAVYHAGGVDKQGSVNCDSSTTLTSGETKALRENSGYFKSIELGECIDTIGENAFINQISVSSLTIPSNITTIESGAFADLGATSITFENGIETIQGNAFYGTKASSVVLPNSVETIGIGAFGGGISLASIEIGSGVTSIGEGAFAGTYDGIVITIHAVTPPTIASNSMLVNPNLNYTIYVPYDSVNAYKTAWTRMANNIKPIGFEGKWIATYSDSSTTTASCDSTSAITRNEITKTNLVSVEIGNCVTSLGQASFYSYNTLTSVTLSNSITSIGTQAFEGCSGLTSINIPSGVTSIGSYAFANCSNITSITVNAATPPTLTYNAFYSTNNCPIYVPSESVDTYKTTSEWSDYASRIQPIT